MKNFLFLGIVLYIQVYSAYCSESSDESIVPAGSVLTLGNYDGILESGSEVQSLSIDVPQPLDTAQHYYLSVVGDFGEQASTQYAIIEDDSEVIEYPQDIIIRQVPSTVSQVQVPMPMPMQTVGQGMQLGQGGKVQWIGGPVNFDNMVDCKFYRQNPGFCVPMSIYTPCSRCKAGVRTIFRTSYKVRCPSQDSFPPQLRPYFTWVPTSHRNPKRENKLLSRWRRQFMCIVMAISEVPRDVSTFWQHSQISYESGTSDTPQTVPLLLGPYGDQSASLGYTTAVNYPVGNLQNTVYYSQNGQQVYTVN